MIHKKNIDHKTVDGFGDEWARFDQSDLHPDQHRRMYNSYFQIFPWSALPDNALGFDLGCGSGRWAMLVAPRVKLLHCIDPSSALEIAKRNLAHLKNCEFHASSVDAIPLADNSMDFGYCLGVLHHVPDPQSALTSCVNKLKPGAPFLIYIYYSFENRPLWFRYIWRSTDILRRVVSKLPNRARYFVSQIIAGMLYWPLARLSRLLENCGLNVQNIPLSSYRSLSFYSMRTDALDRFGTRIEKRFSKNEVEQMMRASGLTNIEFSDQVPFWCAVGFRQG